MTEPLRAGDAPKMTDLPAGRHAWCACGRSRNQPFCDGSHQGTCLAPVPFEVAEPRAAAMCMCKRTGNAPFCDGSHRGD